MYSVRSTSKCYGCGKQFSGGFRLNNATLFDEYIIGKQTYAQLSIKYGYTIKTIQRRLDSYEVTKVPVTGRGVIVLMDTTYWGGNFGVMLFKDAITKENLLKYYVKHETNSLYVQGIGELKSKGFAVIAIVCDGRKGLIQSFPDVPVQMLALGASTRVSVPPNCHYTQIFD